VTFHHARLNLILAAKKKAAQKDGLEVLGEDA
jgi:hypothetical protein